MRIVATLSAVLVLFLASSASARQQRQQQPNQASTPAVSIERVQRGLERSQQRLELTSPMHPIWTTAAPTHLGILTLLPPEGDGEVIRAGVPIGELATRAAHAVSSARYRRAERKADERIQRAIQDFQAQTPER
jgi:hypothetical protein